MPEGILEQLTQLIDEPINTIAKQVKDYEEEQKKKNSKHDKEEKKDPAEYPAGFSYSWNCASGHVDYKNK